MALESQAITPGALPSNIKQTSQWLPSLRGLENGTFKISSLAHLTSLCLLRDLSMRFEFRFAHVVEQ